MGLGHKFKNIRYGPSPINFYTVLTMAYKTCSTADLLYNQYNMREREREREREKERERERERGGGGHEA